MQAARGFRGSARRVRLLLALLGLAACGGSSSPTGPAPQPLVYAALGASDAVGVGAFPTSEGYVFRLAERMRGVRAPVTLHNLGINGARIEELLADELPRALAARPQVVTVWAGANDVIGGEPPDRFAEKLSRLLAELRSGTSGTIFVGDLPDLTRAPFFQLFPDPDVTRERVAEFNARIHAAVSRHGAVLVPLARLELDLATFSIDGFHPSNLGHARIADLYWTEIAPRL